MSNEQETITNSDESTNTETVEQENQETQQEAQGQENQVATEQAKTDQSGLMQNSKHQSNYKTVIINFSKNFIQGVMKLKKSLLEKLMKRLRKKPQ